MPQHRRSPGAADEWVETSSPTLNTVYAPPDAIEQEAAQRAEPLGGLRIDGHGPIERSPNGEQVASAWILKSPYPSLCLLLPPVFY